MNAPTIETFITPAARSLDPIHVFMQDFGDGIDRLTMACYTKAWTACWSAMGSMSLREFVMGMEPDYIVGSLHDDRPIRPTDARYLHRIVEAVQEALRERCVDPAGAWRVIDRDTQEIIYQCGSQKTACGHRDLLEGKPEFATRNLWVVPVGDDGEPAYCAACEEAARRHDPVEFLDEHSNTRQIEWDEGDSSVGIPGFYYLSDKPGGPGPSDAVLSALHSIKSWSQAYPLAVFTEPDWKKAAEVLKANGMTLDGIAASNMRHVITKVQEIVDAALPRVAA